MWSRVSLRQSDSRSCTLKSQHSIASLEGPWELVTIPFPILQIKKLVVGTLKIVKQCHAALWPSGVQIWPRQHSRHFPILHHEMALQGQPWSSDQALAPVSEMCCMPSRGVTEGGSPRGGSWGGPSGSVVNRSFEGPHCSDFPYSTELVFKGTAVLGLSSHVTCVRDLISLPLDFSTCEMAMMITPILQSYWKHLMR